MIGWSQRKNRAVRKSDNFLIWDYLVTCRFCFCFILYCCISFFLSNTHVRILYTLYFLLFLYYLYAVFVIRCCRVTLGNVDLQKVTVVLMHGDWSQFTTFFLFGLGRSKIETSYSQLCVTIINSHNQIPITKLTQIDFP